MNLDPGQLRIPNMNRTRDEAKWKVPFHHYETLNDFLSAQIDPGVHSFQINGREIDILTEDRSSQTTLIAFGAAVTPKRTTYPSFSGRKLAATTGANLIAISDPILYNKELFVGWYLGDKTTGPLFPHLTKAIRHILAIHQNTRTILFGASAGGFAAAQYARYIPESIVVAINPRLSLERTAREPLRAYLEHAHGIEVTGALNDDLRTYLSQYGHLSIERSYAGGLPNDLLIYHNILDGKYLRNHLIPVLHGLKDDPKLRLIFGNDGPGHRYISAQQLNKIMMPLVNEDSKQTAIKKAGFRSPEWALQNSLKLFPGIAKQLRESTVEQKLATRQNATLENRIKKLEAENSRLQAENEHQAAELKHQSAETEKHKKEAQRLNDKAYALHREVAQLSQEPKLMHRVWRLLPFRTRQSLKSIFFS